MDPVTHTLIGVGVGNAFFRKSVGRGTAPILAIASNLPDIDAFVHLSGDPASVLMRRTFGHSLLLFPIWAVLLSLILRRFYPHVSLNKMVGMCLAGAGVHVFFDLVNSFGVVLLWPLSDWRPELAILFIIDLVLTGFVMLPLFLCLPPFMRRHITTFSRVALACAAFYVGFCGMTRGMADRVLAAEIASSGADFRYVFPEPFGPHRWRGVAREDNLYRLYLIRPLSSGIEHKGETTTRRGDPYVEKARSTRLARGLEWFFKAPVWLVKGDNPSDPLQVSVFDLRFRSILIPRDTAFAYRFNVFENGRVDRVFGDGRTETLTSSDP